MKKTLALLLALVMALGCTAALAEEVSLPTTTTVTLSLNQDIFNAIAGAASDEQSQQLLALVTPMVNNLSANMVMTETGAQIELKLKDTAIATLAGSVTETGVVMVSDLFPTYALTCSAETLQKLSGADTTAAVQAMATALQGHMESLMTSIMAHAGEAQMGEYSFDGGAFNVMTPIQMTQGELAQIMAAFVNGLKEDAAFASVFGMVEQAGAVTGEQNLADMTQVDPEDAAEPVEIALYSVINEQGEAGEDAYVTFAATADEKTVAVCGGMIAGSVYAHVLAGEEIYASADEMRQAAAAGSGDAMVVDLVIVPGQQPTDMAMGMDLYVQGVYVGYAVQTAATQEGLTEQADVFFMTGDAPLLTVKSITVPGGEVTAAVSTEGKTVVGLSQLAQDEDGAIMSGLLMDVMNYGLNNLLANAAAAMPTEVSTLVSLLTAAPAETTEVPAEGVNQ